MSAKDTLQAADTALSVAWEAARALLGSSCEDWEPDTWRLELKRHGIEPSDALMAKLLAAQTVCLTNAWAYDHDALFAFALACDGLPASYEEVRQPTVEQLCWALHELRTLTGHPLDNDEGFDPDEIDAAVAVILTEEGFVQPPTELAFCADVHNQLSTSTPEFRRQVTESWSALDSLPINELKRIVAETDEDELGVQLRRLADVKCYLADRLAQRHDQLATRHSDGPEHDPGEKIGTRRSSDQNRR